MIHKTVALSWGLMMRQRRRCSACDRDLPLWVRADKRSCDAKCRMRASRMRKATDAPLTPRAYRVRQPIPRKHHSPALLRIAGVMQARAEQAERERNAWQQRHNDQAAELMQLRAELAAQKQTAAELERAHVAERQKLIKELEQQQHEYGQQVIEKQQRAHAAVQEALRREFAEKLVARDEMLAQALAQLDRMTEEREELRERLEESESSQEELQQESARRESAEETLRQQSVERAQLAKVNGELRARLERQTMECQELNRANSELNKRLAQPTAEHAAQDRTISELRTKLEQTERAHKEVSEVADSQRRTIRYEQQRRAELEKQLDMALKAPKTPAQNPQDSNLAASAWAAHQRAEQLAIENQQLRRHRDAVAHERERLSNGILRIMSPGQYLDHATSAGYDPTRDPLIQQKCHELRVLDYYSRWQRTYMQRVTARKLKEQRTIDEQAIEAALTDRWKLMTKPLVSLGSEPKWIIVGFMLDERSEAFLQKQSEERSRRMRLRMNW